jgi:ABC-2 type transport system permease protein
MRLMADEKKQKTDQLLLTAPVGLFRLVMGKFLAAFAVFLSSVFILLFFGIVLSFYAQVNWPMIFGNILGLLLIGSIFISAGLLISSLTENQMIAAIGAIGVNIMILLLDVLASVLPWKPLANVVSSLAVLDKYSDFTYGIFSVGNVLYFISVTVIFLFLTVRILERRRWA